MTPAQREAFARVAASDEPVRLPGTTARILSERYGYIARAAEGWVLTETGRASIDAEAARERRQAALATVGRADWDWADRVWAWLEAHARFADWSAGSYVARQHVRDIAACDHAGTDLPVVAGDEVTIEWLRGEARSAARCLSDYDEEERIARERGVGVHIHYAADEKVPQSRSEAAAKATSGNVVGLRTYRERRPSGGAA